MTREEAIRILDPETTGEALAEIEYYNGFSGKTAAVQAVSDACILAVAALREQEERENLKPLALDELRNTNADRIRSMTDQDLAVFLSRDLKEPCDYCQLAVFEGACAETLCDDAMMKWLQQPAEGE